MLAGAMQAFPHHTVDPRNRFKHDAHVMMDMIFFTNELP